MALRYADAAAAGLADHVRVRVRPVFASTYDEIAATVLHDVCRFGECQRPAREFRLHRVESRRRAPTTTQEVNVRRTDVVAWIQWIWSIVSRYARWFRGSLAASTDDL